MTAALWFRITLKDLYGIEASDNIWFNGRTKALSRARECEATPGVLSLKVWRS